MKEIVHLCLVAPVPPPYGGISNWVLLMKNHIEKNKNVDVTFLNVSPKNRGVDGRTLWNRIVDSGLAMFVQRKSLKNIIINKKPNIIHITTSGSLSIIRDILLLKTAKKFGVPTVYHIRFGRIKEIAKRNTIEWKLISRAIKLSSKVMAIDGSTYDTIKKFLPKANAVCVPNPVDISALPKLVLNNSKIIMFLGWVVKTKGIEELLEAWEKVYAKYKDWNLAIIGPCKEDYLSYLNTNYSNQGVIYTGEKCHDEALEALNNSEIFVLPSYTEGFPNAVVEAMALGKPIIATEVGAIPDMLSNHCGLVIPTKSSAPIEKALLELLSDLELRKKLSLNALKKAHELYTIENVFQRYMSEWMALIGKNEEE